MNMLMILRIIITMATAVTKTATIIKTRRKKNLASKLLREHSTVRFQRRNKNEPQVS